MSASAGDGTVRDKPVLVTGAAGFIGFHIAARFLKEGRDVVGLDNLNDYYETSLKEARLAELKKNPRFRFLRMDLADEQAVRGLFEKETFGVVYHLAAQPGVRYSFVNPQAYVHSNLVGFANLLEGCRHGGVGHLVFASSSSVYGNNKKVPFAVGDPVDH